MRDDVFRPRARTDELVVEELDGELLVYDKRRDKAHRLNGPAAAVWRHCDGRHSIADLASFIPGIEDPSARQEVVRLAVRQLDGRRLLEERAPSSVAGVTRREVLRKLALAGAAGLSIPVVKSIVAPTAAQAATCLPSGFPCLSSAQCCSGVCSGGFCL